VRYQREFVDTLNYYIALADTSIADPAVPAAQQSLWNGESTML